VVVNLLSPRLVRDAKRNTHPNRSHLIETSRRYFPIR